MKRIILILLLLIPIMSIAQQNGNSGFVHDTVVQRNMKTVSYDITLAQMDSIYICEYATFFNGWFVCDSAGGIDGIIQVISHSTLLGIKNTFVDATYVRFSVALISPVPSNPGTMGKVYLYKCGTKVYIRNLRYGTDVAHIRGKLEFFN